VTIARARPAVRQTVRLLQEPLGPHEAEGREDARSPASADHVYGVGTSKARNGLHDVEADGDALLNDQCKTYSVVVTP